MDSSDFIKKREEDKDIKLFQEEYPDIYDFVLKLIDGQCNDEIIEKFINEYDKEICNDILKMTALKVEDKDANYFQKEYPDIYDAIRKLVGRRSNKSSSLSLNQQKGERDIVIFDDFFKYQVVDKKEGGMGTVLILNRVSDGEEFSFKDTIIEKRAKLVDQLSFIYRKKLAANTTVPTLIE